MPLKSYKQESEKTELIETVIDSLPDNFLAELGISREDLKVFAHRLDGRITFRDAPESNHDNKADSFLAGTPKIIVCCATWNDVRISLEIAHTYTWWVACRSGGHSTAGFSTNNGMVIDVGDIKNVQIDTVTMQMTVGAGANWKDINAALDAHKVHVPGSGCSSVGIAGYMQGGGYGFTSRQFGMNSDSVIQVTVMLADGSIILADENKNSDLFWAIRGGTGGNFGVLLEIKYQLYNLYKVWGFVIKWSLEHAPAALVEMQKNYMMTGAPSRLNYQSALATLNNGSTALVMMGMYDGDPAEGKQIISSLLNTEGAEMITDTIDTYTKLNRALLQNLNPPVKELHELKRCGYVAKLIEPGGWKAIVDHFSRVLNKYNIIAIEPYGGAINDYPVDKSAFIHRNVYMNIWADSFFDPDGKITPKEEAEKWLKDFMTIADPQFNGHVYQNYPFRDFPNFRWAYWGDAFGKLLGIKKKYDPNGFFYFEQSISEPPSNTPPGNLMLDDPLTSGPIDPVIAYEFFSRPG